MDLIQEVPVRRFEPGRASAGVDRIITEARIELDLPDAPYRLAMLCLPAELEALAVGFLVGEGVLRRREDLASVTVAEDRSRVVVRGEFDADALEALSRRWTWGSGCGAGGTGRDLDAMPYRRVPAGPALSAGKLRELAEQFLTGQTLWRQTGGVHAAALAGEDGIVLLAEDVGRHNAFDKVVGRALLDEVELSDKLVLTTGRLSAEIVSKAVACGVAMLASRSAATSLAVALGRRFGLTLVAFLRGQRMNVYTGYERLLAGDANETEEQP